MITVKQLDPNNQTILQTWNFDPATTVIRMGREKDNDIIIQDYLEVSRYHVEIHQQQDQWRLISKGTNKTFLNGFPLSQGAQSLVPNLALIQLAQNGPIFQFEFVATPVIPVIKPIGGVTSGLCQHQNNPPQSLFCIHCGKPIVTQEEFIRQYQILRVLGRGGMGTTYIAWDQQGTIKGHPLLLVLKEMNADMAKIPKAVELFEREAKILHKIKHLGVPEYYDFFIENNKKYLAMELIHGKNLEQIVIDKGGILPQQAIEWMLKTCDILSYLHSFDPPLVHRDIKPANLMLRNLDQQILLLDFGAVKEIGTPLGTCISSEGFGSPEQMRGQPCIQSDLYAIGTTLIFLLTSGHAPQEYQFLVNNEIKFNLSKIPTISTQLRQVIEKVCSAKVGDRYQSAQELSHALKSCSL